MTGKNTTDQGLSWIAQAACVTPSPRQYGFLQNPFYAFIHFGMNTFTGQEWGSGREDPALFCPTALDCDQWVAAVKAGGMTGLILTCKHHDGFCLWPTKTTPHSVRNSPWKQGGGDVVREAAEACRRGGIRFGVYLSPWDRNSPLYGSEAYNNLYKAQLTELLTGYGELFCVWFDGACGEGANGRRQRYDFDGYISLVRRLQPNACIFHDNGPDIRWVGNESGTARESEWMVVPHALCFRAEKQVTREGFDDALAGIDCTGFDLGGRAVLEKSGGLCFCPAETDMSIRPGWFHHPEEEPHSLKRLKHTYLTSVGGSTTFNLNVPPMKNGQIDARDVARLRELGEWLRSTFSKPIACGQTVIQMNENTCQYRIVPACIQPIRYIVLREDILHGQRIEAFRIEANGKALFEGTTVGSLRICPIAADIAPDEIIVRVLSSRLCAEGLEITLY